jgi:hypothetical protein
VLWPDTVVLAGVSIPLAGVLADLTMHHGREDISDEPTASTLQLTLEPVTKSFVTGFDVGQTLTLTVSDDGGPSTPRFTGTVTDAQLDVDRLTVIAAGGISKLRLYSIGAADYPVETWSQRVTRAFTDAGVVDRLELVPDPGFDPQLAARVAETAGETTLGDYLAFLVAMVGALVSDRPNGDIFVQAVGARTLDGATQLDPADVLYAPIWTEQLPRGNIVTVRYTGDQSEAVTLRDDVSVGLYGERPETIDTAFVSGTDATTRANSRLGRGAYAHWNIPQTPLVRGLDLEIGSAVILDDMPDSSPSAPWNPLLEGWTDEITGDEWRMTLALSDPLLSGLTLVWSDTPADVLWSTVDPATDWTEALTLEDLYAG